MTKFDLVDVFVGDGAKGNPCAVVFVDDVSRTAELHAVAVSLNQPATTFLEEIVPGTYRVRWFAPESEIDLCGHGSLGAFFVLGERFPDKHSFTLQYAKGEIKGEVDGELVSMTGAAIPSEEATIPDHVSKGFGQTVLSYHSNWNKPIVVLESPEAVKSLQCDWALLASSNTFAYAVTAQDKSGKYDFVSRVILPHLAKKEDQATGSAQLVLAPYWKEVLEKDAFRAFQVSPRGGRMDLEVIGDLVKIQTRCIRVGQGSLAE